MQMTYNEKVVQKIVKSEKRLLRSFGFAWRGIKDIVQHEKHTLQYFILTFLVLIGAILYFEPTSAEIAVLILTAVFAFTLEFMNSLFERMLDIIQPERDERVRHIKDVMAGLVLLASVGAAVIGLVVLLPYLLPYVGALFSA